jgi:predicted nucleotidyltransferase
MSPNIQNLRTLKPQIIEIASQFGVSDIRVFGSVARGTAKEGSDVDLLVQIEAGRSLLDLIGFEQKLEDEFGISVDIVVEGGIHPMLESAIFAEARPL